MADTVIDHVPPTIDEARKPKRSRWRWVLAIGTILALVAGGVGFYFYWFVWRDTWSAHLHVPDGTNLAFRADGKQLWLFPPFREHVVSVLRAEHSKEPDTRPKKLVRRIEDETGIDFSSDVRDVVVASVDALQWVVLVAGKFAHSGVVEGFQRALDAEGVKGFAMTEGMLSYGKAFTVAQAEDGTLILATSASLAQAALPPSEAEGRVPLPTKGAVSFLVKQQAWSALLNFVPSQIPGVAALRQIGQASGVLTLGDAPRAELALDPTEGSAAEALKGQVDVVLSGLRLLLTFAGPLYGGRDALRSATTGVKGGKVVVAGDWPTTGLEDGCKALGELIQTGSLLGGALP